MGRLWLRSVLRPTLTVAGLVGVVGGMGGLTQALLLVPVTPDLDLVASLALAALGAAGGLAVPVAVLAGVAGAGRALQEDRAWLGLGTLGVGGNNLLRPIVLWLGLGVLANGAVAHLFEPLARARLRDVRALAAARVEVVEGRTLHLGDWYVSADAGRLHFVNAAWMGSAGTWRIEAAEGAVVATLTDVAVHALDGSAQAQAASVVVPVPLHTSGVRVEVAERTSPDLLRVVDRTPTTGSGRTYERWILWKRTLLPLGLLPVGLLLAPLALGQRRTPPARSSVLDAVRTPSRWPLLLLVAAPVLTLWVQVRVLDRAVGELGLPVGSALLIGPWLLAAAWTWWRWEAR